MSPRRARARNPAAAGNRAARRRAAVRKNQLRRSLRRRSEFRVRARPLIADTESVKFCCLLVVALPALGLAADITPRAALIEIYGAHKVPADKIRKALGTEEGGPLPSRQDAEDRIDKLPGIVASRIEAACCLNGGMILYVGVQEKDAPHFEFHPAPTAGIAVPDDLQASYKSFLDAVAESIHGNTADEDLTNGYSLMADSQCRQLQQSFIPAVERNLSLLDRVLREAADPE